MALEKEGASPFGYPTLPDSLTAKHRPLEPTTLGSNPSLAAKY